MLCLLRLRVAWSEYGDNSLGTVTSNYFEGLPDNVYGGNYRGFVQALNGAYATFDAVPSPSTPCCTWTFPTAINQEGTVVGYENDYTNLNHGFLRSANGTTKLFSDPDAGSGYNQGTVAAGINLSGIITGYYVDGAGVFHGFVLKDDE